MDGLTFRKARPADTDRIAEIMFGEPRPEAIRGIGLGDVERLRAIGRAYVRMPGSPKGWQRSVVAELDGQVVGVLQTYSPVSPTIAARMLLAVVHVHGPLNAMKLVLLARASRRAQAGRRLGGYHVSELHVDSRYRNLGIGAALLGYAEDEARKGGHRLMSLEVLTTNPAHRLYERAGFRVVGTRSDAAFERFTGAAGNHEMAKHLD